MNGSNECSKVYKPFFIIKGPHPSFNSTVCITDDPITSGELTRNSISIEQTRPERPEEISNGIVRTTGSVPTGGDQPPFQLQGLTILSILNLKSKSFNCWQVTDHLRKLFPNYCQSDHFTVVMLKIVMFMSQNPQIFIRK